MSAWRRALACCGGALLAVAFGAQMAAAQPAGALAEPGGVAGGPQAEAPDLVQNGSFELVDASGRPQGFSTWVAQGKPELVVDEGVAHRGQRSIRLSGDGRARANFSQSVANPGGGTYRLTVWYRTSPGLAPDAVVVRLMAFHRAGSSEADKVPWREEGLWVADQAAYRLQGANLHITPSDWPSEEGSWQPLSLVFSLPPEVVRLEVDLFNWFGQGDLWFDDLSLVRVPATTLPAAGVRPAQPARSEAIRVDLGTLRREHPRLLATRDDFARLQELVARDEVARRWYSGVKARAEQILREPVSRYEIPDGLRLLATSRRVLDRIYRLALAYRLEGDRRFLERAWQELEAAAAFPDWNPRHFLDTAEMTHAFAIAYDWLYEAWTPEQRALLRRALVEKGLRPALGAYRGTAPQDWSWWVQATHNWNLVCNGGIALGALALADEEPELAAELLTAGLRSVPRAAERFAPDGGWDEGVGYWHYSIRYLVPYLAALQSALGTDFGLGDIAGVAAAGFFPIYMTGPTNSTFNFADGGAGAVRPPELFWMARRYGQPAYAWWQAQMAAGDVGDLLWYEPGLAQAFDPSALPLDRHFRGVEAASFRSAWNDPMATFVAFKAGDNRANHGDLDMGSFVLDALGVRWAEELGADDYNLPGYFGSARWTYYRKRAEGQNTLVINPGPDPGQDPQAASRITYFASLPGEARAIADLTPGYRRYASRVERGFALLDGRRQVLVQDELSLRQPGEVWWFLHTRAEVELGEDGATAVLRLGEQRLQARILAPTDARFQVLPAAPLPGSPNPAGQNPNSGLRKLAIHLTQVSDLRLAVLLTPLRPGEAAPVLPAVVPLAAWRQEGDSAGTPLWPALPRARLQVELPGERLQGRVPVGVRVAADTPLALERVALQLDGQTVYEGSGLPEGLTLDTRRFPDGRHTLRVRAYFAGLGGQAESSPAELAGQAPVAEVSLPVSIVNWWQLSDPLEPPLESGWFGTLVRRKTSSESGGWREAVDGAADFGGDGDRLVRAENTEEYLVWEAPALRRFQVRLYARQPLPAGLLRLAVSADGQTWRDLPYASVVTGHSAGGWLTVEVRGDVPEGAASRWFRLTLERGPVPPDQVQLGQVELAGLREDGP